MATTKRPRRRSTLGSIIAHRDHWRARYTRNGQWHTPGHTFSTFALADGWLADEQRLIDRDEWTPPAERRAKAEAVAQVDGLTFGEYSDRWVEHRQVRGRPIKATTAHGYRDILARQLAHFRDVPLVTITREQATAWYQAQDPAKTTIRAHAYALFRSIMATAVDDGLIPTNPVMVRGAGHKPKPDDIELFTPEQIAELAALMPDRHRAAVLLAAWCGLRFGELAALRRSDLELDDDGTGYVNVRRGVVKMGNRQELTTPKSASGIRRVPIPPHIVPAVHQHLRDHAQPGDDGLLFPPTVATTDYLTPGQLYGHRPVYRKDGTVKKQGGGYYLARHKLGRDDLSFHKLRHFAATNFAIVGATTRELMDLMGHAAPDIAMRYQHTVASRLNELAVKVSTLAEVAT